MNSNENIFSQLEQILREKFALDGQIAPDTKLIADLHLDSLQLFEFVTEMEERFGVSIPAERLTTVHSVGDAAQLIETVQREETGSISSAE